jgi:hypothetical protein
LSVWIFAGGTRPKRKRTGHTDRVFGTNFSMYQRWNIVAAILVTALLIQIPFVLNADLGWLLTANEKS